LFNSRDPSLRYRSVQGDNAIIKMGVMDGGRRRSRLPPSILLQLVILTEGKDLVKSSGLCY